MSESSDRGDVDEEIESLRRNICSRDQFLKLLRLLRRDYSENHKDWQNPDIESYLEAIEAFSQSLEGYYQGRKIDVDFENPGWRVFADILLAARVYE